MHSRGLCTRCGKNISFNCKLLHTACGSMLAREMTPDYCYFMLVFCFIFIFFTVFIAISPNSEKFSDLCENAFQGFLSISLPLLPLNLCITFWSYMGQPFVISLFLKRNN